MDPNNPNNLNNPYFNTQFSSNFPPNYYNPNDFQSENQFSTPPRPQNVPQFYYQPNAMPSAVPNWNPYYAMQFPRPPPPPSQTEYPEFSTQMGMDGMSGADEGTPTSKAGSSTTTRRKVIPWSTADNLVLISGWIKYGTDSIVGKNQKGDSFWGKITDYCNEHCGFDPPRDVVSCKNRHNYINARLGKWVGAYDNAKRLQQSGWSENDVLLKAYELYKSANNSTFNLMEEWKAIRDQPRYASLIGGNTGSDSSGSKRAREGDEGDSNSIGSIPRPMGREAAKKKAGKKKVGLSPVKEQRWSEFAELKSKAVETVQNLVAEQQKANDIDVNKTRATNRKTWMQLSQMEFRDGHQQKLYEMLTEELFGNDS